MSETLQTPARPWNRPRPPRVAGVLLIVAAILWFCLEALAASRFRPRYSYAHNYISDLGVPDPGTFEGRAMDSPLSAVANFMFLSQGILFLVAAILLTRAIAPSASRRAFLLLAIGYAIGFTLIATFHGSEQAAANGTGKFHVLGGAIAAISGNVALIVAGLYLRKFRGHNIFGVFTVTMRRRGNPVPRTAHDRSLQHLDQPATGRHLGTRRLLPDPGLGVRNRRPAAQGERLEHE